jgi:ubiquinone biosynthesis protein
MRWIAEGIRLKILTVWDRARGRRDPRSVGRRLRRMFERMGGTAVKIGQQLSVRIDLLPFEVCDELSHLLDSMPAFDVADAIAAIERTIGKPLEEAFSAFDPQPIGSASIACVYRAELKTGEPVVVKVKRPSITQQFAADLRVMDWMTKLPEALALVRPDFFRHLRREFRDMLLEELDFRREARYQRLFRRATRKAKIDWLSAPRVYSTLCGPDVIVSEFVTGIWCRDLLAGVEGHDHAFMAYAQSLDIDPKLVARRVLHTQFWSCYEGLFFHADPHPSNVLIQPGSKVIFLDFGACGTMSHGVRRDQQAMLDRLVRNDVEGMADVAMQLLAPLPRINEHLFHERVEAAFHRVLYALRDKESAWWERTTMFLWLVMVNVAQEFQLPVNIDVIRQFRSSLLYDTLAFRLDGHLDLPREYRKYREQAARRTVRSLDRAAAKVTPRQVRNEALVTLDQVTDTAQRVVWSVDVTLEKVPPAFAAAITKGSYVAILLIQFTLRVTLTAGLIWALAEAWQLLTGQPVEPIWTLLRRHVMVDGFAVTIVAVLLIIGLRRILMRLSEPDDQGTQVRRPWT